MFRGFALSSRRNPEANLDEMHMRWGFRRGPATGCAKKAARNSCAFPVMPRLIAGRFCAKKSGRVLGLVLQALDKPEIRLLPQAPKKDRKLHGRNGQMNGKHSRCACFPPWRKLAGKPKSRKPQRPGSFTALSRPGRARAGAASVELYFAALQDEPRGNLSQQRVLRLPGSLGTRPVLPSLPAYAAIAAIISAWSRNGMCRMFLTEGSVFEFNGEIEAGNPLNFPNFDERIAEARKSGAKAPA